MTHHRRNYKLGERDLAELLIGHACVPPDAAIVNVDAYRNPIALHILVEHPTYGPVLDDAEAPMIGLALRADFYPCQRGNQDGHECVLQDGHALVWESDDGTQRLPFHVDRTGNMWGATHGGD